MKFENQQDSFTFIDQYFASIIENISPHLPKECKIITNEEVFADTTEYNF